MFQIEKNPLVSMFYAKILSAWWRLLTYYIASSFFTLLFRLRKKKTRCGMFARGNTRSRILNPVSERQCHHHPRCSHHMMKGSVILFISPSWRFSWPHERQCHLIHLTILGVLMTWWRQCHLIHLIILGVLITSWKAVLSDSSHHPRGSYDFMKGSVILFISPS